MSKTKSKKTRKKKGGFLKFLMYTLLTVFIIALIAAGAVFKIVKDIIDDTEPIADYNIEKLLEQNSYLYDKDGNLIQKIQDGRIRTIIDYEKIDQDIIDAFVAIEDKTFFEHKGFNYIRLIGAVVEALKSGEQPAGTSTITQQYARNMYLAESKFDKGQKGYIRKIKEAYYTIEIEKTLDKKQIITAYLNTIDLGGNVQGIEAAAQRYFSKSADNVDYIEAAILAGIPKATSSYSPFININNDKVTDDMIVLGDHDAEIKIIFNEAMISRFKTVIYAMKNNGYIDEQQAKYAIEYAESKKIIERFKPGKFNNIEISSYFVDMVKDDVVEKLMTELKLSKEDAYRKLYGGGLHIYSTLDTKMQKILERNYNGDTFSNRFDANTRKGVIAFQKKHGLTADGYAGKQTIAKLAELELLDLEKMTKDLYKSGMQHEEVIFLKEALEKDGVLFKTNDNLPFVEAYRDANKNILLLKENSRDQITGSKRILNHYHYVVNNTQEYVIHKGEYSIDAQGNITLYKNRSLNFYNVKNPDGSSGVEAFIKDVYKSNPESERVLRGARKYYAEKVSIKELYIFKGKNLIIPFKYKKLDDKGNLVVSSDYKSKEPKFYRIDENGDLLIGPKYFSISTTGIIQPQSAMVIIDYHIGELRAIVGGRNVTGQKIYNRAINPRQPGSAIKPLSIFTPALDKGLTVATVFDDVPRYTASGRRWPQNYFDSSAVKYKGIMTMREALHDSNNVVAVKIAEKLGVENLMPYLENFGISTLVTEGNVNDVNFAAVALGGMSQGIKPLDITAGYGALANEGIRKETITFTKILDKENNLVLENKPYEKFVVDKPVAYLAQHMMESGARQGLAKRAAIRRGNKGIPIAGKTGTTSSKNDAWFVGYTPYYVAGTWIGNDIQVSLSNGSASAADFWKIIMTEIHKDLPDKSFKKPSDLNLISMNVDSKSGKIPTALSHRDPEGNTIIREYFIPGTQPTEKDDTHVEVTICSDSQRLITPYCPESTHIKKVLRLRLDEDYDPNAHGQHYAIADDAYTIPRSYFNKASETVDFASLKADPKSPFCFIHTSVPWTAQVTADMLPGVTMHPFAINQLIIGESLIIKTIHHSTFRVDAGSRINDKGTIIAYDIADPSVVFNVIYPWQIKSFKRNPDGPDFILPTTTETTFSSPEITLPPLDAEETSTSAPMEP